MKALFIDIDGVLHPSPEILNENIPTLALQGSQALLDIGLCRWAGYLEDALCQAGPAHHDIALIVHSSWRNSSWATTQVMREMLGPLGHRFLGFTRQDMKREISIDDAIATADIADYLIIDDAIREFTPGREHLLITNPLLGMSEASSIARVSEWVKN